VQAARAEAERRGVATEFLLDDLRTCRQPDGSLAAIFFTYDVYSFVPGRIIRIALLRKMSRWLRPDGVVFLSARRFARAYDPMILTLQRAVGPGRRRGGWGESHTRWLAPDATMHRSFVQVFTHRAIRREVEEAGFLLGEWRGNHCLLAPRRGLP